MLASIAPSRCSRPQRPPDGALPIDPTGATGNGRAGCEQKQITKQGRLRATLASLTVTALLGLCASAPMAAPPANDNFSSATGINFNALPFSETVNITDATTENGESQYCFFSIQSVWYKLTPAADVWLGANTLGSSLFGSNLNIYRDTGSGIFGLAFITCSGFSDSTTFRAQAGTTYYLQAQAPCCGVSGDLRVNVYQVPPPVPVAGFYFYPSDPSFFDTVQFFDNSHDPGQVGFQSWTWNFGDGSGGSDSSCCPTHRYAADGDYSVQHTVTTLDGRTGSTSGNVRVRTHDVAITKFKVPQSAAAGQTRQISVGIRNSRYPETVRVELYKSFPSGFQFIGFLEQSVPVRPSNRTTDFNFSYTFTSDDARIGKVTFKAVASIVSGRDAIPADNEAISLPTKVYGSSIATFGNERMTAPEAEFALLGVAPNPATAGADLVVRLSLPERGAATLQVLDIAGRVMTQRNLDSLGPGSHEVKVAWAGRPASGIYWVRLTQRDKSLVTRVTVLQ